MTSIAQAALERLFPQQNQWAVDPVGWVETRLGGELWSKQKEILEALRDNRYVAVKSCHGPGKSFTASCAGAWWIDTHELGSAFLVTTAPSYAQVETILWREFRRRHQQGNLPGRITLDCRWHLGSTQKAGASDEELVGVGRKPADYDENSFQGIHARYFMAILDEACGIPEWLWDAVLALATNENSRILAIGNPTDPNSRFKKFCDQSNVHTIKIGYADTPHYTEEHKELSQEMLEVLISPQWVDDRRKDWGEGSPNWIARVEGEFPDVSDEYLISPALVEQCQLVDLPGFERGRYGMDVARKGSDKTVIYRNRGGQVRLEDWWSGLDTMQSAGRAARLLASHGANPAPMNVDIIGVGAGVYDRLREQRFLVAPHQGSQRARDPKKFKNRRSEVWWTFKESMEAGLIDLDPADDTLAGQLTNVKWGIDSSGRIYVETREDMEDRGVPSPDFADAAVMSTIVPGGVVGGVPDAPRRDKSITGDLLTKVM